MQRNPEQGACDCNMVFRSLLAKILQGVQSTSQLLYLVENDECFLWLNWDSCERAYGEQNAPHIIVRHEKILHPRIVIAVNIGRIFIPPLTKFFENISFPYLPGSKQDERFPVNSFSPSDEVFHDRSFHNYLQQIVLFAKIDIYQQITKEFHIFMRDFSA